MEKTKIIEIKNVKKAYKMADKTVFHALHGINLEFTKGELVSVVGESGSGKSTLMNLIGGLDSDFEGDLIVQNENIRSFKENQLDEYRKHRVGFVFQNFNLIDHLSVLENVTMAMTLCGSKGKHKVERATSILKKLGIEAQMHKKPNQLSGGQKQRVAIARALINEPDVILADEPTGALDGQTTLQILEILKSIADEGKLVIMVTHSEKVASISSRIVEMQEGKIVRDEVNAKFVKTKPKKDDCPLVRGKSKKLGMDQSFKIAFSNMMSNKAKNILMAFGFTIGIMSVVLMLAFSLGMNLYVAQTASSNTSETIVEVSPKKSNEDSSGPMFMFSSGEFTQDEIDELSAIDGVIGVEKGTMIVSMGETFGSFITINVDTNNDGIFESGDEKDEEAIEPFAFQTHNKGMLESTLTFGAFPTEGENEIVIQASNLATYGGENLIGKTVLVNVKVGSLNLSQEFKVCGLIEKSGFEIVYSNFNDLVEVAKNTNPDYVDEIKVTSLHLETTNAETAKKVKAEALALGFGGSMMDGMVDMFQEMSAVIDSALLVIVGISLLVSLIMILVVLYISVSQRTKEIGVLKSIGARRTDIKSIFVTESFLIGLFSGTLAITASLIVGGVLNLILQSLIGFSIVCFTFWHFLTAMLISVSISMLAGLYPSAKAASLDPVESLRS